MAFLTDDGYLISYGRWDDDIPGKISCAELTHFNGEKMWKVTMVLFEHPLARRQAAEHAIESMKELVSKTDSSKFSASEIEIRQSRVDQWNEWNNEIIATPITIKPVAKGDRHGTGRLPDQIIDENTGDVLWEYIDTLGPPIKVLPESDAMRLAVKEAVEGPFVTKHSDGSITISVDGMPLEPRKGIKE